MNGCLTGAVGSVAVVAEFAVAVKAPDRVDANGIRVTSAVVSDTLVDV